MITQNDFINLVQFNCQIGKLNSKCKSNISKDNKQQVNCVTCKQALAIKPSKPFAGYFTITHVEKPSIVQLDRTLFSSQPRSQILQRQ